MKGQAQALKTLIEPGVEALGYELLGVEYQSGRKHALLRVYIDSERGIGVDDCARVSHQVSGILAVEDPIEGGYDLEVSSPGLDRPLFEPRHFERHRGAEVKVRLTVPLDGRRNFRGVLEGCRDGRVLVMIDGARLALPLEHVGIARLVPEP